MTPSQEWKILISNSFNFLEIGYCNDYDQRYVDFVERWGEPSVDMVLHVIEHARGDDRIAAMRILRLLNVPQTVPYLLPFLESLDLDEQGASAICLGELSVSQAYPVLKRLVFDGFISLQWFRNYDFEWLDNARLEMVHILGKSKDVTIVPLFEDVLSHMVTLEEAHFSTAEDIDGGNLQLWYTLQDALVYTLGIYQAFENIANIALTQHRFHCWIAVAATGFLQKTTKPGSIHALFDNSSLRTPVAHIISNTYNVSLQEAQSYVNLYIMWHFDRMNREKPNPEEFEDPF